VRAARKMPELTLDARTVVWGHSQGGHAALWTGKVGPHNSPDVRIAGVAAIAPAANMTTILATNPEVDKRLGPYLALSYSRFYPDITFEEALRADALAAAREMVNLCGFLPPEDAQRLQVLTMKFQGPALATSTNAALEARLAENTADHPVAAPVLIAQGLADDFVPPPASDLYVVDRCDAGQQLEYWTFKGLDHRGIVQPGSSLDEPLLDWTKARFTNEPPKSGCARRSF
jgi:pimeloyl-ACP methyl ester carboxylesterase